MKTFITYAFLILIISACSAPQPILYPNDHLKNVGNSTSEQDIDECRRLAENYGTNSGSGKAGTTMRDTAIGATAGAATGAVGGAIAGRAGRGAAIGAATGATAGLLRGIFSRPQRNPTHTKFVNRCLKEKGYDVIGWD